MSLKRKIAALLPDKLYLQLVYHRKLNRWIDFSNPTTYNEKLQWLKVYDHNDFYTSLVDKYEVKDIVSHKIGEQYVVHTYGVWNSFDEIDFDKLPESFVLKCTHDSGGLYICKKKSELNPDEARTVITASLKNNYYKMGREWPYKNVKPRIIAEEYMEDDQTKELRDYKFFVFDGKVRALFIATERQVEGEDTKFDFFDENGRHLDIKHGHKNAAITPELPRNFELMKELASKLAEGIPHVRVDFYEVNGRVYFGELTFYHHGGFVPFEPEKWDRIFGEWLVLPQRRK